jgi:hypothetical protein
MTTQEFINKYMNKKLDTDGYPSWQPYQCVDVIRQYQKEVIGSIVVGGNAIDYWYQYPYNATLKKYYDRIPNTLTFVPKLGDIGIFAAWANNPYGHIGICTNAGNMWYFTTFDQNWPSGSPCHYVSHNYLYPKFLGVLRPKV